MNMETRVVPKMISSEVAIIKKKEDYDDLTTMGLAQSNDGKEISLLSQVSAA